MPDLRSITPIPWPNIPFSYQVEIRKTPRSPGSTGFHGVRWPLNPGASNFRGALAAPLADTRTYFVPSSVLKMKSPEPSPTGSGSHEGSTLPRRVGGLLPSIGILNNWKWLACPDNSDTNESHRPSGLTKNEITPSVPRSGSNVPRSIRRRYNRRRGASPLPVPRGAAIKTAASPLGVNSRAEARSSGGTGSERCTTLTWAEREEGPNAFHARAPRTALRTAPIASRIAVRRRAGATPGVTASGGAAKRPDFTSSSASLASPISRRRSFGSLVRHRSSSSRRRGGVDWGRVDQSISRSSVFAIVSLTVSPSNARFPVRHS